MIIYTFKCFDCASAPRAHVSPCVLNVPDMEDVPGYCILTGESCNWRRWDYEVVE